MYTCNFLLTYLLRKCLPEEGVAEMTPNVLPLMLASVFCALFGLLYLTERGSKTQERTAKPSRLMRISTIAFGLIGTVIVFWIEWRTIWLLVPALIVLMGSNFSD
jgi:hypothetical protein